MPTGNSRTPDLRCLRTVVADAVERGILPGKQHGFPIMGKVGAETLGIEEQPLRVALRGIDRSCWSPGPGIARSLDHQITAIGIPIDRSRPLAVEGDLPRRAAAGRHHVGLSATFPVAAEGDPLAIRRKNRLRVPGRMHGETDRPAAGNPGRPNVAPPFKGQRGTFRGQCRLRRKLDGMPDGLALLGRIPGLRNQ